ncbi:MAG: AMIN domain-containing protein [Deltaproteobacteria bacterium]|nr:AMIN domain-containing protein [Deltaproteobacteria bacterium]
MRLGLAFLAALLLSAPPARAVDLNTITAVEVRSEGGSVLVTIQGSRPPNFTTFSMMDPPRFVIDLSESQFKGVPEDLVIGDDTINVVKNLSYGSAETSIARVMIAFNRDVDPPDVQSSGTALVVRIPRPAAAPAVAQAKPAPPQPTEAELRAQAEAQAAADARAAAAARERAALEAKQAEADAQAKAELEARARAEQETRQAADSKAAVRSSSTAEGALAAGAAGAAGVAAAGGEAARTPESLAAERARQEKENEELLAWKERQRKEQEEAEAARRKQEEEARVQVTRLDELNRQKAEAEAKAREEQAARDRAAEEARQRVARARETATVPAPVTPPPAVASPAEQAQAEQAAPAAEPAPARSAPERLAAVEPTPAPARSAPERLAAVEPAPAPPRQERLAAPGKARQVKEIGFQQNPESSRVFVRLSDAPSFQISELGENVIQVELANTRATRRNDTRQLDTSFFASAVAMVAPRRQGSSYVVEIRLKQKVPYQQSVEGDLLAIDFERPASLRSAPAAVPAGEAPAEPGAPVEPEAPAEAPAPGR